MSDAKTTGGGLRLWKVGSWQEGPFIGGGVFAFSPAFEHPSGKLLAVDTGYGEVRLVNPDTGREYARLEAPRQNNIEKLCFNADGTQLLVSDQESVSIHAWDLRLIRAQLAKRGLDWDLPEYPSPASDDSEPISAKAIPSIFRIAHRPRR